MVGAEDQELASWRRFKFTVLSSSLLSCHQLEKSGKGEANRESGTEIGSVPRKSGWLECMSYQDISLIRAAYLPYFMLTLQKLWAVQWVWPIIAYLHNNVFAHGTVTN